MANKFRYRSGAQKVVSLPCDSAIVLSIGDMVFLNTDDVRGASDFTWNTDLATTQAGFADVFLGICLHQSASGDTDPVAVDISSNSIYKYGVASASYAFGAIMGPDKASGNALLSDTLEAAVATSSVAKAMEIGATVTELLVSFASAYNVGANAAASVLG